MSPALEIYTISRTSSFLFLFNIYYHRNFLALDEKSHLDDFTDCQKLLG